MILNVIQVNDEHLLWGFESAEPKFSVVNGSYTRHEGVDPFPGYAHDRALVEAELARVAGLFPISFPVYVYLPAFECTGRTNGHAFTGHDYDAEMVGDSYPVGNGTIVLSGKRIPPHPAMTRYLVAHEYGHLLQKHLEEKNGFSLSDYAEMRGVTTPEFYGGRTWHRTPGEVFANDFRILVCESEVEFWPHAGVPRPDADPRVVEWWALARATFVDAV